MEARVWELEEGEIEEIEVEDDSLPGSTTTRRESPPTEEVDQKPLVLQFPPAGGDDNDDESQDLDTLMLYNNPVPNIVKICGSDGNGRPLALFKSSTLMDIGFGGGVDLVEVLSKRQQLDDSESWERDFKQYRREQEERHLRLQTKKTIKSFVSPATKVFKRECHTPPSPANKKTKMNDGAAHGSPEAARSSTFPVVSHVSSLASDLVLSPEWEERCRSDVAVETTTTTPPPAASPPAAVVDIPSEEELKDLADALLKMARKERGLDPDSPRRRISKDWSTGDPAASVVETSPMTATLDEVAHLRDRLLMSLWRDSRADGGGGGHNEQPKQEQQQQNDDLVGDVDDDDGKSNHDDDDLVGANDDGDEEKNNHDDDIVADIEAAPLCSSNESSDDDVVLIDC